MTNDEQIRQLLYSLDKRTALVESHLETLAVNQVNLSLDFKDFCKEHQKQHSDHEEQHRGHDKDHKELEHRMTKSEQKAGLWSLLVSAMVGALANIKNFLQ